MGRYQTIADVPESSDTSYTPLFPSLRSISFRSFTLGILLGVVLSAFSATSIASGGEALLGASLSGALRGGEKHDFDVDLAKTYFDFSASTYCVSTKMSDPMFSKSQREKIKDNTGITVVNGTRTLTDLAAVIGTENDGTGIVMSFRGSQTPINMLSDLLAWKSTAGLGPYCDGCTIHAGILLDYESIRKGALTMLKNEVRKLKGGRKGRGMGRGKQDDVIKVTITGHSLGGALAALTALEYESGLSRQEKGGVEVNVFTFGEPRVGNDKFADAYNKLVGKSWRVVNKADVVSHIPMSTFGYVHEGVEVWMRGGGRKDFVVCDGGEDPNCSNSLSWLLDINDKDHTAGWFGEDGTGGMDGTMCNV